MESTKLFKNDSSEVLVLPPNILEKLGINLGNIQSCSNGSDSKLDTMAETKDICISNIDGSDYVSGKINDKECNGSSILETANLMKASVFLSPTFTNLKPNNGISDLELNNFDNTVVSFECNVSKPLKSNSPKRNGIFDKISEKSETSPMGLQKNKCRGKLQNSNNKINIISEEIIGSEKIKELITSDIQDNCNLVPVPINTIISKNGTNFMKSKESVQLLNENNNNEFKGEHEKSVPVNGCKVEENKIPIINYNIEDNSNKAITYKEFVDGKVNLENELNEDVGTNNNCEDNIPEKHSLLERNDNIYNNKHFQQNNEPLTSEEIVTVIDVIDNDIDVENVRKEDMTVIESVCNFSASVKIDTVLLKNYSEFSINEHETQSYDLEVFKDDDLDPRQEGNIIEENLDICRNKIINVNQNKVKSKLCIQGVEKPGGDDENQYKGIYDKDLKTYARGKRTKFLKQLFLENQDCLKSNLDVEIDVNLNVSNINSNYEENSQKFCVCKDFGYFSYYKKDNEYQHLHYWEQKSAECSLETLLSIYEENKAVVLNITDIDDNIMNAVVPSDNKQNNNNVLNICWMSVNINMENTKDIEINQQADTQYKSQDIEPKRKRIKGSTKINEIDHQDVNMELQQDVSPECSELNIVKSKNKNRKHKIEDSEAHSIIELKSAKNFRGRSNRNNIHNNIIPSKTNVGDESQLKETELENMSSEKPYKNVLKETKFVCGSREHSSINELNTINDVEMNKSELCTVELRASENKTINIVSKDTDNTNHNKTAKKRKSSFPSDEGSSEISKKRKIEDIEDKTCFNCGVCKDKVESSKWDCHVKDHCFIAWKEGQEFDFKNQLLFDQLKQRLNDNGQLVCVICDRVIKRVKKFLSHVEVCIASKNHIEVTDSLRNDKSGQLSLRSKHIICGVCKKEVTKMMWLEHIAKEHNYLAWKDGETALDIGDEAAVTEHLHRLASDVKKFECKGCGIRRKCADFFLKHIKSCGKPSDEMDVSKDLPAVKNETSIKCGVCQNSLLTTEWQNHILKEHKYLAWKAGEPELDINDSDVVYSHLYNLSKELGGLLCSKCGCRRKYVNSYLKHIEKCNGEENPNCTMDSTMNESNISMNKTLDVTDVTNDLEQIVRCGVCSKEIDKKNWENHIKKEHFYKAWRDGQTPVNLDDEEDVYNHLYAMCKKYNGLTCKNCGTTRKYVKVFLQHIETCNPQDAQFLDEVLLNQETCKCGVCGEEVPTKSWKSHAMKKHYNVAWLDSQTPIDTNNGTAVEKCLKEYKQMYNRFVCNVCGITRVSAIGFFAHVVQCGKTEEEIDKHRGICDICNNKYLLIYKNQHISMHRDQEYAKQRKLELQVEKEEKQKQQKESHILPEKRLAAERALNVIEKYKKQFKHKCPTCDFGGDSEDDIKKHTCSKTKYNFSESEDSLQFSSEQESEDTDVNCELLDEELDKPQKSNSKKKKHADPNPATAFLTFPVKNTQSYLAESAQDFRDNYLTSDILYPHWRTCKYEIVPDEMLSNYLPILEESCQLQLQNEEWITIKKFEANNDQKWVSASFTGGCIQCVSWCPPHKSDVDDHLGHLVSAAVHKTHDAPRLPADTCFTHHAMLQIWDYGDMRTKPKFALGVALDFGTIWAKDWCPSGTRDLLNEEPTTFKRLGLLAIACSNGSSYILSVPYPSTIIKGEKNIFKLKPVAELRLARGSRQKFQATAINWPAQKGHSTIVVGYSDGTIASYNLECDSPLLTDVEDDVKIYYPYQDERIHNTCVTAVTSFPTSGVSCPSGSSSATGGSRAVCRGAGRGSRSAVTATSACFMPHWPDLLLAGNDAIVYQASNVLSWVGGGRRLGSQQSCAGCPACGRVALVAPPAVRLVTTHPVHRDLNKITVAVLQMKPLVDKKSKQKNDDLATRLEPTTYEDAIRKYGVELKLADDCDRSYLQQSNKPRDHYPERFPLSDVPAMAFNLSPKQHKKLAIATHSGFIFVLTVQ